MDDTDAQAARAAVFLENATFEESEAARRAEEYKTRYTSFTSAEDLLRYQGSLEKAAIEKAGRERRTIVQGIIENAMGPDPLLDAIRSRRAGASSTFATTAASLPFAASGPVSNVPLSLPNGRTGMWTQSEDEALAHRLAAGGDNIAEHRLLLPSGSLSGSILGLSSLGSHPDPMMASLLSIARGNVPPSAHAASTISRPMPPLDGLIEGLHLRTQPQPLPRPVPLPAPLFEPFPDASDDDNDPLLQAALRESSIRPQAQSHATVDDEDDAVLQEVLRQSAREAEEKDREGANQSSGPVERAKRAAAGPSASAGLPTVLRGGPVGLRAASIPVQVGGTSASTLIRTATQAGAGVGTRVGMGTLGSGVPTTAAPGTGAGRLAVPLRPLPPGQPPQGAGPRPMAAAAQAQAQPRSAAPRPAGPPGPAPGRR